MSRHETRPELVMDLGSIRLHALMGLLALVLATSALMTLGVTQAAAHDSLVSSNPKDGAELAAAPQRVVFVFSGQIQQEFAQVAVVDSTGDVVISGEPVVDGTEVRLALPALDNDTYLASYRVVSSDGHPIDGTITFAVAEPPAPREPEPKPATSDAAVQEPATSDAGAQEPAEPSAPAEESNAGTTPAVEPGFTLRNTLILLGTAAAAGALLYAGVRVTRRDRARR